uniref:Uncharacterized protein n=1 Tax=Romanomermis culicivorax TaxID=13658 RepID=A0A915KEE1_ROMCU
MSNYLRLVAQQGENPELRDTMEQMQTMRQSKRERITIAIAECDKEMLPQKSTNLSIGSLTISQRHIPCLCNYQCYSAFCQKTLFRIVEYVTLFPISRLARCGGMSIQEKYSNRRASPNIIVVRSFKQRVLTY